MVKNGKNRAMGIILRVHNSKVSKGNDGPLRRTPVFPTRKAEGSARRGRPATTLDEARWTLEEAKRAQYEALRTGSKQKFLLAQKRSADFLSGKTPRTATTMEKEDDQSSKREGNGRKAAIQRGKVSEKDEFCGWSRRKKWFFASFFFAKIFWVTWESGVCCSWIAERRAVNRR